MESLGLTTTTEEQLRPRRWVSVCAKDKAKATELVLYKAGLITSHANKHLLVFKAKPNQPSGFLQAPLGMRDRLRAH